jgi:hypothetical protein
MRNRKLEGTQQVKQTQAVTSEKYKHKKEQESKDKEEREKCVLCLTTLT